MGFLEDKSMNELIQNRLTSIKNRLLHMWRYL